MAENDQIWILVGKGKYKYITYDDIFNNSDSGNDYYSDDHEDFAAIATNINENLIINIILDDNTEPEETNIVNKLTTDDSANDDELFRLLENFDKFHETIIQFLRYIANVISKEPGRPILLNVAQLTKTNHQTIATLFNESMSLLWPSGVQYSKVLLFVTDTAPYMVKSATALKVFYPVMLHVTCLAHGLHRIAESVRSEYKAVDKLVASAKKIFLKAPDRVTAFHAQYPGLLLPPKPILTRWGMWQNCVKYYSEHLNQIEAFVQTLDPDDSSAIKEVHSLFEKKKLKIVLDIVEIQQFYSGITDTITMLEKQGMELTKAVELWEDSISYLALSPNSVIVNKTASISSKNLDLPQLIKRAKRDPSILQLHPFNEMTPAQLLNYNFAPLVSCDVERSFSMFKSVLRDNHRSFLLDNLKEHLVIGFYARV